MQIQSRKKMFGLGPPKLFSDVYGVAMPPGGSGVEQPRGGSPTPWEQTSPFVSEDRRGMSVMNNYSEQTFFTVAHPAVRQMMAPTMDAGLGFPSARPSSGGNYNGHAQMFLTADPRLASENSRSGLRRPHAVSYGYIPALNAVIVARTDNVLEEDDIPESIVSLGRRTVILTTLLAIPVVAFLLVFTELGFGATVYKILVLQTAWPKAVAAAGAFCLLIFYILDLSYWSGRGFGVLRVLAIFILAACATTAVVLSFQTVHYAPIFAFFVGSASCVVFVFYTFYASTTKVLPFLKSAGLAAMIGGMAALIAGLVHCHANNFWWGNDSRVVFKDRLRVCQDSTVGNGYCTAYGRFGIACSSGCVEVPGDNPCKVEEGSYCLAALLLWGGPMIMGSFAIISGLGIFTTAMLVSSSLKRTGTAIGVVGSPAFRAFILCNFILIGTMYMASWLGGTSAEMSGIIIALSMLGTIILFGTFISAVGFDNVKDAVSSSSIFQKFLALRQSDWLKAMLLMLILPLVPCLAAVSFLNQLMRKCLPMGKKLTDEDRDLALTLEVSNMIKKMSMWRWTSVIRKAILVGFGYFALVVGIGKVTQLFLAWLNIKLLESGLNLWAISAIIYVVAILMFLNPVVPGPPMYVCCGVTITAAAEKHFGNFEVACAWAIFVAMCCKLSGSFLLQKVIGEVMGNSVAVRSMVMVNSSAIKAFKLICQDKGLNWPLIVTLVGGPDWPVSVMAGVLKQSVVKMLIGTLPIVIPVAATVIAGGCLLKAGESDFYSSLAGGFSGLSAFLFGAMGIGFFLLLERVIATRGEELQQIPDDEEVKKMDRNNKIKQHLSDQVTNWSVVPLPFKCVLVSSALLMWCATMVFALNAQSTFEPVDLTTDYRLPPFNGDLSKMLKSPVGLIAGMLEIVALFLYMIFKFWANVETNLIIKVTDLDSVILPTDETGPAIVQLGGSRIASQRGVDDSQQKTLESAAHDTMLPGALARVQPMRVVYSSMYVQKHRRSSLGIPNPAFPAYGGGFDYTDGTTNFMSRGVNAGSPGPAPKIGPEIAMLVANRPPQYLASPDFNMEYPTLRPDLRTPAMARQVEDVQVRRGGSFQSPVEAKTAPSTEYLHPQESGAPPSSAQAYSVIKNPSRPGVSNEDDEPAWL